MPQSFSTNQFSGGVLNNNSKTSSSLQYGRNIFNPTTSQSKISTAKQVFNHPISSAADNFLLKGNQAKMMLNLASQKFSSTQPTVQKDSPVTGILKGSIQGAKDISSNVKAMAQAPGRALTSGFLQPVADILSILKRKQVDAKYTPQSSFEKMVFGETPIKSMFAETTDAFNNSKDALMKVGLDEQTANGSALLIAPLFVGGMKAMDLVPSPDDVGKGSAKASIKKGIKQSDEGFKGLKGLSTKLIEDLKGRTTVSKSYIEQRLASSDLNLKQVEKDLIRNKLIDEADNINVAKFADKIQDELLPLKVKRPAQVRGWDLVERNKYENISLPKKLKGNVANYSEHIYESPIKTSAGDIHFNGETNNYFGHTRVEDMADGITRRVIEDQSDLYQKGNLENEFLKESKNYKRQQLLSKKEIIPGKRFSTRGGEGENIQYVAISTVKDNKYKAVNSQFLDDYATRFHITRNEAINDFIKPSSNTNWNFAIKVFDFTDPVSISARNKELLKLSQYNDPTAHFRMVREEVKQAAIDGKTKLQFPTGETAMKIEGLSSSGKVDTNNPIYKFYEKDLGKYLKSKYDAKLVTDKQGVSWYELNVNPELKNKPIEAFGKVALGNLVTGGALAVGASAIIKGKKVYPNQPQTGYEKLDKQEPLKEITLAKNNEQPTIKAPVFSENGIPKLDGTEIHKVKLPTDTPNTIKSIEISQGNQVWKIKDKEKLKVANRIKQISDSINPQYTNYLLKLANFEGIYNPKQRNKNSNGSIDMGIFQINNKAFPQITPEMADNLDFSVLWAISLIDAGKQKKWVADNKSRSSKIKIEN